jgi:hypothetical protein
LLVERAAASRPETTHNLMDARSQSETGLDPSRIFRQMKGMQAG